jgi:hypothetical protein
MHIETQPSSRFYFNVIYNSSCAGTETVGSSPLDDDVDVDDDSSLLVLVVAVVEDDDGLTDLGARGAFLLIKRRTWIQRELDGNITE